MLGQPLLTRLAPEMICPAPTRTLEVYFRETYKPERLVGCSPKTLVQYSVALGHWIRFAGAVSIEAIDKRMVADFSDWLLPTRSPATVNKIVRHVMPILRFAAESDDIEKAPRVKRLRERKAVPLALTVEEFGKVLKAAQTESLSRGGTPGPIWWRALLLS